MRMAAKIAILFYIVFYLYSIIYSKNKRKNNRQGWDLNPQVLSDTALAVLRSTRLSDLGISKTKWKFFLKVPPI